MKKKIMISNLKGIFFCGKERTVFIFLGGLFKTKFRWAKIKPTLSSLWH